MTDADTRNNSLCAQALAAVKAAPRTGKRKLVALAGAPASGKSTLGDDLARALVETGVQAQVVPMDGFHLHNDILSEHGLLSRKGAPQTFDHTGLLNLVARLKDEDDVYYPLFDRTRDIAIAGAGHLQPDCDTVIVEGNYLLLDMPSWNALSQHWDMAIMLSVPLPVLTERLISRWRGHGLTDEQAVKRAQENDLPNAQLVVEKSMPASVTLVYGDQVSDR